MITESEYCFVSSEQLSQLITEAIHSGKIVFVSESMIASAAAARPHTFNEDVLKSVTELCAAHDFTAEEQKITGGYVFRNRVSSEA